MTLHIIYLAAGNSRRFGNNKLYHEIAGRPMFLYGLDILEQVLKETENTVLTVVTVYEEIRKEVLIKKRMLIIQIAKKTWVIYQITMNL